jgi:hypothetical protein
MYRREVMSTICFTGHRPDKLGGFEHSNPLNMMIESGMILNGKNYYFRFNSNINYNFIDMEQ